MFLQSVTEVVFLLIPASKVHWRVQPKKNCQTEQQNQDAWRSVRIARVAQQLLHENCPHMIEKEQWPLNNFIDSNIMEISRLWSVKWSYFETFIRNPNVLN